MRKSSSFIYKSPFLSVSSIRININGDAGNPRHSPIKKRTKQKEIDALISIRTTGIV
jgi:hypothetical protein